MKKEFIFWIIIAALFLMGVYDWVFLGWIENYKVYNYVSEHVFIILLMDFVVGAALWYYRFFYILENPIRSFNKYLGELILIIWLCFGLTFGWTSLWNRVIGVQDPVTLRAGISNVSSINNRLRLPNSYYIELDDLDSGKSYEFSVRKKYTRKYSVGDTVTLEFHRGSLGILYKK